MRYSHRKNRLMTGVASLTFFVAASLCFGFALQGRVGSDLLGFHIDEDATTLLDFLPFFHTKAETSELYPLAQVHNPMVLVNFPSDKKETWLNDEKLKRGEQVLNGSGVSLQSYIRDISMNRLHVNSQFYGYGSGMDGFMAPNELSYYIGTNGEQLSRDLESEREEELLRYMIDQLNQDGSLLTMSCAQLDTNEDGYMDNMTFVIHGNKNNDYNLLWPHQYSFTAGGSSYPKITCDNGAATLKVKDYMVIISGDGEEPMPGSSTRGLLSEQSDIGVIAHEYLHMFGFPDLYHNYKYENDTFVSLQSGEQRGDPLGQWDIMDNTISDYPQNPLYYTNMTYAPWRSEVKQPLVISESTQNIVLNQLDYTNKNGNMAAIIKVTDSNNARSEDEYFMVEYRTQTNWDTRLPNSGLLVYRINTGANLKNAEPAIVRYCTNLDHGRANHCGNMFGPPDEVYIFRPGVNGIGEQTESNDYHLLDAPLGGDGAWQSLGKTLDEVSGYVPSEQFSNTIYYSDGSNSGIVIQNVQRFGDTIRFDVMVPEAQTDHEKPQISETISGNGILGRWTNQQAQLSVAISDEGKGLAAIEVVTSDGELAQSNDKKSYKQVFTASQRLKEVTFTFYPKTNGTYVLKATDLAGNVSDARTIKVENIDRTSPHAAFTNLQDDEAGTKLSLSYQDDLSGIEPSSLFYALMGLKDDPKQGSYTNPIHDDVIHLPMNYQGKVCVNIRDRAGNGLQTPLCRVISDDHSAPALTILKDEQEAEWIKGERIIYVQASDRLDKDSGLQYMEVTSSDGAIQGADAHHLIQPFAESQGTQEQSFAVKANGTYSVAIYDYADNRAQAQITITNIDNSAPVIEEIIIRNEHTFAIFPNGAYRISIQAYDEPRDANSGLKELRYQLIADGDVYEAAKTSSKWQRAAVDQVIETPQDFIGTIYVYAIDKVGNESRIYQKRMDRTNQAEDGMMAGIQDATKRIALIGISDSEVILTSETVELTQLSSLLDQSLLANYDVHEVYRFTLMKQEAPFTLLEKVTIRLRIAKEWIQQPNLQIMAVNEQGMGELLDSTQGEEYMEFESDHVAVMYALVSEKTSPMSEGSLQGGANTGDTSAGNRCLVLGTLGCILLVYSWRRLYPA